MEPTTWIEVSRDALARNLGAVAAHASVPVCAVVKADAYGHGLVETARTFASDGAAMLAVTRLEEARTLRDAGVTDPVLIMLPVPDASEAVALGCEVAVGSADAVASLPLHARAHLKVDVAMGRLGVRPEEALEAARALGDRLTGVWTHFPDAAGSQGVTHLATFRGVVEALRGAGLTFTAHAANSAALLSLPDARLDMVRVGTLLYGQDPPGASAPWQHAQTWRWFARVVAVRTLPAGATVGYGSEWRAKAPTRVATIPVGYADGIGVDPAARTPSAARALRTFGAAILKPRARTVAFDGAPAPIIGRVAMQALTVDVSALPEVEVGSVAQIPARRMMVDSSIERVHR